MKKIILKVIYKLGYMMGKWTARRKIVRAKWMKKKGISDMEIARRLKLSEFDVQKILKG